MSRQCLFAVQDRIANNELVGLFNAPTAGSMIRNHSRMLHQLNANFENDFILVELGYYEDGFLHSLESPIVHSWDEYKTPENPVTSFKDTNPPRFVDSVKSDK